MGKKKMPYYLTAAMLLTSLMLCPTSLTVAAQTDSSVSPFGSWQPPKDFVDPVTLKIREFKSQGLNEEQITTKLSELGMGWCPETGATWIGRALTAEELDTMPTRESPKAPSDEITITSSTKKTAAWRTWDADWTGIGSNIVSGSMSVQSGGSTSQFLCVQFGSLTGDQTNQIEAVLRHDLYADYKYYTWDNNEGQWILYGIKNTSITHADNYVIMMRGTQDANGWIYDVWIEYQWVRSGHLDTLYNRAGFQKEVMSVTGVFTNDASRSVFFPNWLHTAQGWFYWPQFANHWWSTEYPLREYHYMFILYPYWTWGLANLDRKLVIQNWSLNNNSFLLFLN